MEDDVRIACRELKGKEDLAGIRRLIEGAPRYKTLLIRPIIAAPPDDPNLWWYGGHTPGTHDVHAVMCIEGHNAKIYADKLSASEQMAKTMLKMQEMTTSKSGTHRHELLGPKDVMDVFWQTFRALGRKVVADRTRSLMGSGDEVKRPSKRMVLTVATDGDFKLVYEFFGERAVEALGFDPRTRAKTAHERHCREVIAQGRCLIGREGGTKPVFIAEGHDAGANLLLDPSWVPVPFRARKRLIAGALWSAAHEVGPGVGKEVLFFADTPTLVEASEQAGYEKRCDYRLIAMLG